MLPQTATMIISQQGFPTILSASSQQQHHQQQQQQQVPPMGLLKQDSTPANKKPARVTKIRRTRQSRNPQQSVARRNERERNRVKLINKGFDVLRDNLPAEYLDAVAPEKCAALEGEQTPDLQASCKKSSKAKKFSKVDTLRAAIQHIRMLEELIRSADPHFELAKIAGAISDESLILGYDELDSEPLSIGQPASCASSSLSSSQNSHSSPLVHQHQSYPVYEQHQPTEQFVKLEPHIHQQIAPPQQAQPQQAQPQPLETQSAHFQIMTQVHHDQHLQQQHQMSPPSESSSDQTHQWIRQHQTTFVEQQQFPDHTQAQWYANTFVQQQQHLVLEQQLSPVSLDSPAGQMQHQQHQHQNQQTQLWYAESSPSPRQTAQQQQLQGAQVGQLAAFSTHQQHQIGLYSQ